MKRPFIARLSFENADALAVKRVSVGAQHRRPAPARPKELAQFVFSHNSVELDFERESPDGLA